MHPLQQTTIAEFVDVLPDRLWRDRELTGQILHIHAPMGPGAAENIRLTGRYGGNFSFFHFLSQ